MHVLITKPPVKTLAEHNELAAAAAAAERLIAIEVHKRFDLIYADARDRVGSLGPFSYFTAHEPAEASARHFSRMGGQVVGHFVRRRRRRAPPPPPPPPRRRAQPPPSRRSYYLNSHHVDFHSWCMHGRARAERVTALASDGVATARLATGVATEDTITLAVTWRNRSGDGDGGGGGAYDGATGHATYTASWIAPKADVHSQQRWFYMGGGRAHRRPGAPRLLDGD